MMRWIPLAFALFAAPALAAAPSCRLPKDLAPAPVEAVNPGDVVSGIPVAYYLLAITWTPEWRRLNGQTPAFTPKLDAARRPQGFRLHGLWPNGRVGPPYPRYCRPVGAIPAATVRAMYCRTPSAALLQHEWQAHGPCGEWSDPAAYFRQAATLYDRVVLPTPKDGITAGDLRSAFIARNRWLPREAVFVAADRDGRLSEVRLCYDTTYKPAACPGGTGAPDARRLILTPRQEPTAKLQRCSRPC